MKKSLAALAAVALAVLGVAAAPTTAFANGTVTGTIVGPTSVGIPNAVIEFKETNGTRYYYTDASGNYVADVPNGDYIVYIHAPGYAPEYFDNSYAIGGASPISITNGVSLTISATLADASVITGEITDYLGGPVDGQVFAIPDNNDGDDWFRGLTNPATGAYTIEDLSPGTYYVYVTTSDSDDLIDEWYDNAYLQANATPVVITATGSTTNIDMQLQQGGDASGTVTNTIGSPVDDLRIVLDGSNGPVNNDGTTFHGQYDIHGLLPDTYTATMHDTRQFFADAVSAPFAVTTATPGVGNLVVTPAIPAESDFYAYPALSGPTTVQAGKTYTWTVDVSGDSDVYAILYSDPIFLGAATQNDQGVATLTLTIPAETTPGAHKLTYSSYDTEGFGGVSRQYFAITVTAAAVPPTPAALPATGIDTSLPLGLAGLLLIAGAALAGRRFFLR